MLGVLRIPRRCAIAVIALLLSACGSSAGSGPSSPPPPPAAAPTVTTTAAQNGAVIVSLSSATSGAAVYYTTDGTAPTTQSQIYEAPFLVASNLTVNALAATAGGSSSTVTSRTFSLNIPSGALVWSDEFSNSTNANSRPDPNVWTYDTGGNGWGNNELEDYCAWNSTLSPCTPSAPNAYVGTDGNLHIVAEQPSAGVYTSARLLTNGLFSFQYGRIEFRAKVPEAQGFWPAGWLMGNNVATVNWPACGEMDVLERVDAAGAPDWNAGSVHGPGFTGTNLGTRFNFPAGQSAGSAFHTYGMIWQKGSVQYYIDAPSNVYATYTTSSLSGLSGAAWPFDGGQSNFIILNLAVGGSWPGSPDTTTPFPAEMLVDYVRIYTN